MSKLTIYIEEISMAQFGDTFAHLKVPQRHIVIKIVKESVDNKRGLAKEMAQVKERTKSKHPWIKMWMKHN